MAQQHTPAAGSGKSKSFGFSLLGWTFEARREPTTVPCPQCGGHGMWRPPYSRVRVSCDLCTSAPISQASANPARQSLTLLVRGLQIEAESIESGVVHLAVHAHQQHKGVLGCLRQHLANALFRAADACHPSQHNGPLWVVQPVVGSTPLEHQVAGGTEGAVRYIWPLHDALGQAYYNSLLVHEGVKRHQDGRAVSERLLRRCGQKRAEYSHADFSGLKNVIVDAEGGAA